MKVPVEMFIERMRPCDPATRYLQSCRSLAEAWDDAYVYNWLTRVLYKLRMSEASKKALDAVLWMYGVRFVIENFAPPVALAAINTPEDAARYDMINAVRDENLQFLTMHARDVWRKKQGIQLQMTYLAKYLCTPGDQMPVMALDALCETMLHYVRYQNSLPDGARYGWDEINEALCDAIRSAVQFNDVVAAYREEFGED